MMRPHAVGALLVSMFLVSDGLAQVTPWSDDSSHEARLVTVAPGVQLEVLDWGGTEEVIVFLAGHSYGGLKITRLAAEHPDRVAGLIYIDARRPPEWATQPSPGGAR